MPLIYWMKEKDQEEPQIMFPGSTYDNAAILSDGTLKIGSTNVDNTGYYACVVVNEVGSAMARSHLLIYDGSSAKMSADTDIFQDSNEARLATAEQGVKIKSAFALDPNTVKVTWEFIAAHKYVQGYKVWFKRSVDPSSRFTSVSVSHPEADSFVITDQTAVTDLAKLVRRISVADWRLWLEYHFASDFSPYLPKAFRETTFDFFSRQLYGVTEEPERWKFAVAVVEEQLGEAVAQLYVARYFPPEHKTRIDGLVRNIRLAFETRIRSLDWMDNETRNAALEKLAALQGMIGHPETWRDYSGYTVEPGKLVEAVYASYEFYWREQQLDLHRPVDRKRWIAPAHVVNAFYNPLANSFVLPAGILQPPYFSPDADAAENYGGIGAVIGHEMSHGFDDEGRQSDAAGRTRNWWTEETDERFRAKSYRLIEQYDGYCPWFGACVNGLGTLGENIGDLAGLEIAYAAYRMSLGETEAPVIGGLTGDQRFFIAYARTYRDKVREELARAMLDSDNHAPSRYRVNGVVRNMDAWYAAFDIKPGDRLYLAPNQRVRIW